MKRITRLTRTIQITFIINKGRGSLKLDGSRFISFKWNGNKIILNAMQIQICPKICWINFHWDAYTPRCDKLPTVK